MDISLLLSQSRPLHILLAELTRRHLLLIESTAHANSTGIDWCLNETAKRNWLAWATPATAGSTITHILAE